MVMFVRSIWWFSYHIRTECSLIIWLVDQNSNGCIFLTIHRRIDSEIYIWVLSNENVITFRFKRFETLRNVIFYWTTWLQIHFGSYIEMECFVEINHFIINFSNVTIESLRWHCITKLYLLIVNVNWKKWGIFQHKTIIIIDSN